MEIISVGDSIQPRNILKVIFIAQLEFCHAVSSISIQNVKDIYNLPSGTRRLFNKD